MSGVNKGGWLAGLAVPYYLYPVHASNAFLIPPSLSASIALLVLRFQLRDYAEVVALVDAIENSNALPRLTSLRLVS